MKTTVETAERAPRPFPKLMISGKGCIVLATSKSQTSVYGPCLIKGDTSNDIGFSGPWQISAFYDFEGVLTMENDK